MSAEQRSGQPASSTRPRVAVISVGDELIDGLYPDLNSPLIAREASALGLEVAGFRVVGDGIGALRDELLSLAPRVDEIIVSGGLGPTEDDRTRAEVAAAAGVELVEDPQALVEVRAWFEARQRVWAESNRVQALFPRGARVLANPVGTAPGFALRLQRAEVSCLPGPPRELERLLRDHVLPRWTALPSRAHVAVRRLHASGISEAALGERIREWMLPTPGRRCGITARKGIHTIALRVEAESQESAARQLVRWEGEARERLRDVLFGADGQTLQEVLVAALVARGLHVATAESCTGGLIARAITDVAGSSAAFGWGWVSYANEAKMGALGVRAEVLERHGAVSAEVALELAEGARRRSGAGLAIATTGVAGPTGGSAEKPVGLVWFAISFGAETRAYRRAWPPLGRSLIRDIASREALFLALRTVEGHAPEAQAARPFAPERGGFEA
ncbi:MAG: CinA family nicotinamide mononucleotide deamidase-related protein [Planctomycetes bacterium]|nr:CinA family nicotinamide mononucleotide deamidase-related protein [Planctomycetota bacterium]